MTNVSVVKLISYVNSSKMRTPARVTLVLGRATFSLH